MHLHRDSRLRKHLQTRYDSRSGSYDWDYNMKLLDRGANIIFNRDYSKWRETGVAFQVRESTYETPNRTLASGLFVKTVSVKIFTFVPATPAYELQIKKL